MAENGNSEQELSVKQQVFLTALLTPYDIQTSAKVAGVSERQAHRWIRQEHFVKAMKEAQQDLFTRSLEQLRIGVDEVISKLRKHAVSDEAPHAVQVRAEQIYLEQAINLHKMTELEKRIADLETLLKAKDAK